MKEIIISQTQIIDFHVDLFRKGNFDGLTYYKGQKHKKQEEALVYLTDNNTREIMYGGAAGGAKSFVGAYWLMMMCLSYSETRWFVARHELKEIRQSTLPTMNKLCKTIKIDIPYKINFQDNVIRFVNGSEIFLIDTSFQPTDPMYERLGSLEFTGGWFEEGGKIHPLAYEVLKTRTGRQNNIEYGLLAKTLVTANPTKNWCYQDFYKPWKAGKLPNTKVFIQAFVQDNPFAGNYLQVLEEIKDPVIKRRLLFGDWEWDDDASKLMKYDAITDIFSNIIQENSGERYIIIDVARFGKDKSKIYTFEDWDVISYQSIGHNTIPQLEKEVQKTRNKFNVPMSHVLADEGGVGGGLVDNLGCKGFVSNAAPFIAEHDVKDPAQKKQGANYKNLKSQCAFHLAKIVNERKLRFSVDLTVEQKEIITEDLDSYRRHKMDQDGPLQIEPKSEQKTRLGRSPDDGDVLLMRAYFDLCPKQISYEGTEII